MLDDTEPEEKFSIATDKESLPVNKLSVEATNKDGQLQLSFIVQNVHPCLWFLSLSTIETHAVAFCSVLTIS